MCFIRFGFLCLVVSVHNQCADICFDMIQFGFFCLGIQNITSVRVFALIHSFQCKLITHSQFTMNFYTNIVVHALNEYVVVFIRWPCTAAQAACSLHVSTVASMRAPGSPPYRSLPVYRTSTLGLRVYHNIPRCFGFCCHLTIHSRNRASQRVQPLHINGRVGRRGTGAPQHRRDSQRVSALVYPETWDTPRFSSSHRFFFFSISRVSFRTIKLESERRLLAAGPPAGACQAAQGAPLFVSSRPSDRNR